MTLDVEVGMRTIGVPVVHAVTNDEVVAREDFIDVACSVMRALGARGALHLRAHRITGARFQALAEGLAAAQGLTGGWLIVNDRLDVALASGARGAQLTSRSLTAGDARRVAPTLAGLLTGLQLDPRMVVVELNRTILRDRDAYASLSLKSGDVLEIVHFVGGG